MPDMETCTMATDGEERVYACELEPGNVTHFGTVDRIERYVDRYKEERVRVYFTKGDSHNMIADFTYHVAVTL